MSFVAITQAFNLPSSIKGNTRLTAIAIAGMANVHDGEEFPSCWPSVKTLADAIGSGVTAVKNALRTLEEMNVISRTRRADDGRTTSNLYHWHPWLCEGWNESRMQAREDKERGYPKDRPAARVTSVPKPKKARPAIPQAQPRGFSEWWDAYPRKVGKKQAERSYKAALKSGASPEELLEALEAHKQNWRLANTEVRYIKHPATWLNSGSWTDELDTEAPVNDPEAERRRLSTNPKTGKTWSEDDFGYACLDHGIDPNRYIGFWRPFMGIPGTPQWAKHQDDIDDLRG
jgi:hypothetical protein